MINQHHRHLFRHAGPFGAADDGDARGVERSVLQFRVQFAQAMEKLEPDQRSHAWPGVGVGLVGLLELGEKRDNGWVQGSDIAPTPLGEKGDFHLVEIHIGQWQPGFAEAATLGQGDFKTDVQEGGVESFLVGGGFCFAAVDLPTDNFDMRIAEFGFFAGQIASDFELVAYVGDAPFPTDGFLKNRTETLQFRDNSVVGDATIVGGAEVPLSLAPGNVVKAVIAGQLLRGLDIDAIEVFGKLAPRGTFTDEGGRRQGVTLVEKLRDPKIPTVGRRGTRSLRLEISLFGFDLPGSLTMRTIADEQSGRLPADIVRDRVAKFDPDELRFWTCVNAGHECAQVCPGHLTQSNKTKQNHTKPNGVFGNCSPGGSNPSPSASWLSRSYGVGVPEVCLFVRAADGFLLFSPVGSICYHLTKRPGSALAFVRVRTCNCRREIAFEGSGAAHSPAHQGGNPYDYPVALANGYFRQRRPVTAGRSRMSCLDVRSEVHAKQYGPALFLSPPQEPARRFKQLGNVLFSGSSTRKGRDGAGEFEFTTTSGRRDSESAGSQHGRRRPPQGRG